MDRIFIRDLALRCIIGIFPEERREKQDIVINVEMHADLRKAGRSDNLDDTVDYKSIKKAILKLVEGSGFQLIEALAENIAEIALANDKVVKVVVTIDKPGALRFAKASAVEITRKRM
ncbi:Dihydroneopterin triphosphate 2'-epimerase [Pontiella desulfatans]|uniref:7,8-dihydroneopterin aldolase n=1 Tax=Pontiella desulfatans TaxID=2750659 RepID=A0A6C2U3D1_PONDE|nr:dihydroneopterin aldolase [Pontiella desulfatans]VGO14144.1 Dihydroneopterin triphosphate 2'-epimerase [Pontiella desulfatans]